MKSNIGGITKQDGKGIRVKQKIGRWLFSITVAFTSIFALASSNFAEQLSHTENEGIVVQATGTETPWGAERINAVLMHPSNKGTDVKIAILDTGIDLDHPDLNVAGDVTFVPGTTSGDDDHGHGTLVAGIIAALDNDIGTVGVAPEASIYSVKILNQKGDGGTSSILSGIVWAIENDMQVINMSFGSPMDLPSDIQAALDRAYNAGIVIVAGAGNGGTASNWTKNVWAPARYDSVIAVGATDESDNRYSSSSTGDTLELMAPGVNIYSTAMGGGYGSLSCTSASSPYVAGVAALMIAPGMSSNIDVRQVLQDSAHDLGEPGWDTQYGYGLVDAVRALNWNSNNESSDIAPPATIIKLTGPKGDRGWYRSHVVVEIEAEDNPGGSGINVTQFSLDKGKTWHNYREPLTIDNEGINSIQARSRDKAGNLEIQPAYSEFGIDNQGPDVNISVNPSVIWPANNKQVMVDVLVTSSAADTLSGLSSFEVSVKDEYGRVEPVIGQHLQKQIQLDTSRDGNDHDGRVYTISITATDYAGNTATAETTVTVPHDLGRVKVNKEAA